MTGIVCPLAKAVHHVRRARRHLADGNLGAAIFALYVAGTWLGFAEGEVVERGRDPYRNRRAKLVRSIVNTLATDLGALADIRGALMTTPVRLPRGSVGQA